MTLIKVNCPSDYVYVYILLDEKINKYRFVNVTKGYIYECAFDSVEDALADLKKYIDEGKVLSYNILIDEETKLRDDETTEIHE